MYLRNRALGDDRRDLHHGPEPRRAPVRRIVPRRVNPVIRRFNQSRGWNNGYSNAYYNNLALQRQNQAYALERQQMQNDYNLQMQQMKLIGQNPQLMQPQPGSPVSYGPGGGPGGMPSTFAGGSGRYDDGPPDGGQMQPPPSGFSFSDVPIWAWAAGGLGLILLVARR